MAVALLAALALGCGQRPTAPVPLIFAPKVGSSSKVVRTVLADYLIERIEPFQIEAREETLEEVVEHLDGRYVIDVKRSTTFPRFPEFLRRVDPVAEILLGGRKPGASFSQRALKAYDGRHALFQDGRNPAYDAFDNADVRFPQEAVRPGDEWTSWQPSLALFSIWRLVGVTKIGSERLAVVDYEYGTTSEGDQAYGTFAIRISDGVTLRSLVRMRAAIVDAFGRTDRKGSVTISSETVLEGAPSWEILNGKLWRERSVIRR